MEMKVLEFHFYTIFDVCMYDVQQVVVLSRIIPDEEQALSSAAGIKLLVDILQESSSKEVLALAADCIARLGHTRAGRLCSASFSMCYVMYFFGLIEFICDFKSNKRTY